MPSFKSLPLPNIRFPRMSVPDKSVIANVFALTALLGIQTASISALEPRTPRLSSSERLAQTTAQRVPEASPSAASSGDPLNSPFPIPWNWVVEMQSQAVSLSEPQIRYYRSQALVSPDRKYAAYSRIQMELSPDAIAHTVSSMLFLENLETGDLQFVTASSPAVRNPKIDASEYGQPGMIAILMPIAWSETGDRLLIRGFDSMFGTGLASDYAVVWNQTDGALQAIAPSNLTYSNAVLLGWSQANPENVLFRAGFLGDEQWPMVAVNMNSYAVAARDDQPVAYGQLSDAFWDGPQARIESN